MNIDWDVCFLTDSTSSNSLGRVYSLWLLAERLGYRSTVIAGSGTKIWEPVAGTDFAKHVHSDAKIPGGWRTLVDRSAVVICVKLLPWQLGCCRDLVLGGRTSIVFDIDEPDVEAGLSEGSPLRSITKHILRPGRTARFRWARSHVQPPFQMTVSNPQLLPRYPGTVLPHVRVDHQPESNLGASHRSDTQISFVGTNRAHKGLPLLRTAVAQLQADGVAIGLTITDAEPDNAQPWEHWVGQTSLDKGLALVSRCDISAVPSLRTTFSEGQLPVKLIDAMMLGKPTIGSDLPPIRWAVGDTGLLFSPGDVDDLRRSIQALLDPQRRIEMGNRARARFLELFSIEANAPIFRNAVEAGRS
jgi:glycosyltransferase involved in cell wall biosynthesis